MAALIVVVGNLGVGKTTLTRLLVERLPLVACWERPEERPFQRPLAADPTRWALPNQLDFLLFRAEQELAVRRGRRAGIMDGGLDQDFQVFTRHLARTGRLDPPGFALCERLYRFVRALLPPPELVVRLDAPLALLVERRARRARVRDQRIISDAELAAFDALLRAWTATLPPERLLVVDSSDDDPTYRRSIGQVVAAVERVAR